MTVPVIDRPDGCVADVQAASAPSHIVGMGASAGGLAALEAFFRHMPSHTGLAFVIVQHLSPTLKSFMATLLARCTSMPIQLAAPHMRLQPNGIYLMPAQTEMTILGDQLQLSRRDPARGLSFPINVFFESLAREAGSRAIGIILSGTGSDGVRGVYAIHQAGGLVVVQDSSTAQFDGMPRNACDTGCADVVLAPEHMPQAVLDYVQPGGLPPARAEAGRVSAAPARLPALGALFRLLWERYGIDFTSYKASTMRHRLERRLELMQETSLEAYVERLPHNPAELAALYSDLLIGVTQFFRDQTVFHHLEREVLPVLVQRCAEHASLRVWVAGCATGEEAYSLAILLHEAAKQQSKACDITVFATDVYTASLQVASAGFYPAAAVRDISQDRLARYFVAEHEGYRVAQELRRMLVFARHDVTCDAPFKRIDLVACRNLLIYFEPRLQQHVLRRLHFALNPEGILLLGRSEALGEVESAFQEIDRERRIYRKSSDRRLPVDMTMVAHVSPTAPAVAPRWHAEASETRLRELYDALLEAMVPAGLLVDAQGTLVHVFGEVSQFLQPCRGRHSTHLLDLLQAELRQPLSLAVAQAAKERKAVVYSGMLLPLASQTMSLTLTVTPLCSAAGDVLALFIRLDPATAPAAPETIAQALPAHDLTSQRLYMLDLELQQTQETLRTTVEALGTSNTALQTTNEELLAANEELQSTNEELQSVNEELYTINAEYQLQNQQLVALNNDTNNLLWNTDIGAIFLDAHHCVRKFTPAITQVIALLPHDIGRPLSHFAPSLDIGSEELHQLLLQVQHQRTPAERAVRHHSGASFLMRILPFLTETDEVQGTVVTLTDISAQTQAQEEAALRRFRTALEASQDCVLVLDYDQMRFVDVNATACTMLGHSREALLTLGPCDLRPMVAPEEVTQAFRTLVHSEPPAMVCEAVYRRSDGVDVPVEISLQGFVSDGRQYVLTMARDIRVRQEAERLLQQTHQELEQRVAERTVALERMNADLDAFAYVASHDLKAPLRAIDHLARWITEDAHDVLPAGSRRHLHLLQQRVARLEGLLDDLLDYSRAGREPVAAEEVDTCALVHAVVDLLAPPATFTVCVAADMPVCRAAKVPLEQVLRNLIGNAIKHHHRTDGRIEVLASDRGACWEFVVSDDGPGIPAEYHERIFQMFQTLKPRDEVEGSGIGLAVVRKLVTSRGGTVTVESAPGQGARFRFTWPKHAPERT